MMSKQCACCGQPFTPYPQTPNQSFCSLPKCQRTRKRQWQQAKRQSDPDYRINQRAAQQAWVQRNPNYWRNYRNTHPKYTQHNHEQQQLWDETKQNQRPVIDLAKMDVCNLPSGLYRITHRPEFSTETGNSWVVEITPLCMTCPCKMDVSREDLIDISKNHP